VKLLRCVHAVSCLPPCHRSSNINNLDDVTICVAAPSRLRGSFLEGV
jgi:hypothetical protein